MQKIQATFTWRDSSGQIMGSEDRELTMRITWKKRGDYIARVADGPPEPEGPSYPVLEFQGGPTGHEAYRVEDLVRDIDTKEGPFAICFGTPGSWPRCEVDFDEVKKFLRENQTLKYECIRIFDAELGAFWLI